MNKRLSTILTGLIAAGALIGLTPFANAQPHDHEMRHEKHDRGSWAMMRCLRAADLDEAQKEQVRAILETSKENHQGLREEARARRGEVRELLESGASDAEIGAAARAAHEVAEQLKQHRTATRDQIRSLLSEEQKLRFEGCASAHRGHRGQRD